MATKYLYKLLLLPKIKPLHKHQKQKNNIKNFTTLRIRIAKYKNSLKTEFIDLKIYAYYKFMKHKQVKNYSPVSLLKASLKFDIPENNLS